MTSRKLVPERPPSPHATSGLRMQDGVVVVDANVMPAATVQWAVNCVQSCLSSQSSKFGSLCHDEVMQGQHGTTAESTGARAFAHGSNQQHRQRSLALGLAVAIAATKPEAERYYEAMDQTLGHSLFRSYVEKVVRALREPLPRRRGCIVQESSEKAPRPITEGKIEDDAELQSVKAEQQEADGLRRRKNKKLMAEQQEAEQQKADARLKVNREAKGKLGQEAEPYQAEWTGAGVAAEAQLHRERAQMNAEDASQQLQAAKAMLARRDAQRRQAKAEEAVAIASARDAELQRVQDTAAKAAATHQQQVTSMHAELQQLQADISLQRALAEKETKALRVELVDAFRLGRVKEDLRQQADSALVAAKQEITTFSAETQELKFQLAAERDVVAQAAEAQQHYAATKAELQQLKAEMELQQALAKKETEAFKADISLQRTVAEKETESLRVELADAVRLRMVEKDMRQRADTALVASKQEITTSSAEIQELRIQLEAERDAVAQATEAQQHYAATKAELKQSKAEKEWQQALAKKDTEAFKARMDDESVAAHMDVERARMIAEDVMARTRAETAKLQAVRPTLDRLCKRSKKKAEALQAENQQLKSELQKTLAELACRSQSSQPSESSNVSQPPPCRADTLSEPLEPQPSRPSCVPPEPSQHAPSQPSKPSEPAEHAPNLHQPSHAEPTGSPQPSEQAPNLPQHSQADSARSQMVGKCRKCGLEDQPLIPRTDYDVAGKEHPTIIIDCETCGSYVYKELPAAANCNPGSGVLGKLRVMSSKGTEHERKRAAQKYATKRGELEGIAQSSADDMQRKRARLVLQEDQREQQQEEDDALKLRRQQEQEALKLRQQEWDLQCSMLTALIEKSTARLSGSCLPSTSVFMSKLALTRERWLAARSQWEVSGNDQSQDWTGFQLNWRIELTKTEDELQSLCPAVPTPPKPPWRRL